MRADRCGLTLLEVLVALALLGIGAAAWSALAGQSSTSISRVHARELEVMRASQALARAALLPNERLTLGGSERIGGVRVRIVPLPGSLYDLAAMDTLSDAVILRTTVYSRGADAAQ